MVEPRDHGPENAHPIRQTGPGLAWPL